jgi:chloride channel 7
MCCTRSTCSRFPAASSPLAAPPPPPATPAAFPPPPQATLFLSSNHHTIINLFSIGHEPGQPFIVHFTKGSLICYLCIYIVLMSVGAGVAIPGGLFMPSLIVGSSWGALFGMQLREWLPGWNIQPGVYALMAGTGGGAGALGGLVGLPCGAFVCGGEGGRD